MTEKARELQSISILYVEDDVMIRVLFTNFLKRRFKHIYIAANGKEGLDLFNQHKPDVVVTDIAMPIMNGFKMIEKIIEINPIQPIIVTSGFNEDDEKCKGIYAYLVKPIIKEELIDLIIKSCS
ncbi:MAG: response regulator [Nitrospirae bacterium]|nr:response regulator [Nitrospirota bacterium]